jgi:hypothetical protein
MDSFWNVASALKDAVKQQTAELTASLQNTDWKTELGAFQEGFKEDTAEIGQKAKEVSEEVSKKTIEAAKSLPQVVETLPATSAARAKEAAAQLQQATTSLSKMGQRVVTNTTEILDHFSAAIQAEMNAVAAADAVAGPRGGDASTSGAAKFSRFDADVAAMQRDSSTYCDEPEDAEAFAAWASTFDLPSRKPDIAKLLSENTFMSELQARIVSVVVDYDSFWTRYFYRLHCLEQRHAKVAALTSRAEAGVGAEEVGWDMDDDEEEEAVAGVATEAAAETGTAGETEEEDAGAAVPVEDDGEPSPVTVEAPAEIPAEEEEESAAEDAGVAAPEVEEEKEEDSTEKKKNKAAVDDDLSSLDLSGAEDAPPGADDDDDSDWGDVAEWE